jgi:2-polyprenyl-3-methyl-5-hydroxy-6-metoxy-1,4-benzoquinol methylase
MTDIKDIKRISVDLVALKPIEIQKSVYLSYRNYLNKYFNNGVENLKYFEAVSCPICNVNNDDVLFTIDDFKYQKCHSCKSIYNSPRLKKTCLEEMYVAGEYENYVKKLTLPGDTIRKNLTEVRKFNQIDSLFDRKGNLLDVGCGAGVFITIAAENGWRCTGIELSTAGSSAAKKHGVNIVESTFDEFESSEKFDCITFWGVLEHVTNPMSFLKKALSILNDNGVIVFESPSANSILTQYVIDNEFVPYRFIENGRHLTFFSSEAIDMICETSNCRIEHIESNGLDIQTVLLHEFDENIIDKLMELQKIIDAKLLSDHYRVFLRKNLC